MEIKKTLENGVLQLALSGRLDTNTAETLEAVLGENLAGVEKMILDMAELEYVSSAGLRAILLGHKLMSKQGTMELHRVNEAVMEVFEMTGFAEILHIVA